MKFKVIGKNISDNSLTEFLIERDQNKMFKILNCETPNPFMNPNSDIREMSRAILQDASPLIWAEEGDVFYFGSESFHITVESFNGVWKI